jgi:hypothetical protein
MSKHNNTGNTNSDLHAMYRRWAYMAVAILASALLFLKPVFSFGDDKGIIYVRSFQMDRTHFWVTQTELETGIEHVTAVMSVKWLDRCNKIMLWGSILCLLCFFNNQWRFWIALATSLAAGVYYLFMAYYAMKISDLHYATLYPTVMAILPAIVLQMMVLVQRNVRHIGMYRDEEE